jgi:zinc/manganese transport system ATP-binding protein
LALSPETGAAGRIELREVTVRFGQRVALDAVSGAFTPGSLTAVVGGNGAGKSTLLAAIACLVRPVSGTITSIAPRRLAYLPQLPTLDREFPLTVAELIMLGGWREFGAFGSPSAAVRARAAVAAVTVGLTERLDREIGEVSRGELQRALFARLIMQDAPVILLDEPFAAVDARTVAVLLEQVQRWNQEGRTVIAVLHDLDLVRANFPSTIVLATRCLAWGPTDAALPALAA